MRHVTRVTGARELTKQTRDSGRTFSLGGERARPRRETTCRNFRILCMAFRRRSMPTRRIQRGRIVPSSPRELSLRSRRTSRLAVAVSSRSATFSSVRNSPRPWENSTEYFPRLRARSSPRLLAALLLSANADGKVPARGLRRTSYSELAHPRANTVSIEKFRRV